MTRQSPSRPRFHAANLVLAFAALLLLAGAPARAAIATFYNCQTTGHNGNHDSIFNGFFVQNVSAINLHSATLWPVQDVNAFPCP